MQVEFVINKRAIINRFPYLFTISQLYEFVLIRVIRVRAIKRFSNGNTRIVIYCAEQRMEKFQMCNFYMLFAMNYRHKLLNIVLSGI